MTTTNPKAELEKLKKEYEVTVKAAETALVDFALKHNLDLYMGEYGVDGRTLVLVADEDYDKERGEWLYSSETC